VERVALAQARKGIFQRGSVVDGHGVTAGIEGNGVGASGMGRIDLSTATTRNTATAGPTAAREADTATAREADATASATAASGHAARGGRLIRRLQKTQYGISAGQSAFHTGLVLGILRFIVCQNYHSPARVGTRMVLNIAGRSDERTSDASATIEAFGTNEVIQFSSDFIAAVGKGQAFPSAGIENHDRDAVLFGEDVEGLLGGIGNALDMRTHATADVQEQKDINGHVFAVEVLDRLDLAVYAQNKIAGLQTSDSAPIAVDNLSIDA
jgi:hypothetical protein